MNVSKFILCLSSVLCRLISVQFSLYYRPISFLCLSSSCVHPLVFTETCAFIPHKYAASLFCRLNDLARFLLEFSNESSLLHSFINEKTREVVAIKAESGDPLIMQHSRQKAKVKSFFRCFCHSCILLVYYDHFIECLSKFVGIHC